MNRKLIEDNITTARKVLLQAKSQTKIKKIDKTLRSKMSAFGAAVMMSGPLPAIAYYAENEKDVIALLAGMYNTSEEPERFFDYMSKKISANKHVETEKLLAYSVSLKLALNLFKLEKNPDENA